MVMNDLIGQAKAPILARAQMQYIRDIHSAKRKANQPVISFEFFPPKTEEGDRNLLEKTIPALLQLKPDYCSVTYGAGGSTREKTLMIVDRIQRQHGLTAMAHLTCVGSTQEQLGSVLEEAAKLGIKNILALRGDPPGGNGEFKRRKAALSFRISSCVYTPEGGFSIGTAGFPEGHIACKEGKQIDWQRLKAKSKKEPTSCSRNCFSTMQIFCSSATTWNGSFR